MAEVSEMTGFSRSTITRLFEHERDVLVIERPTQKHKRRYRSIRIPHHVYERVLRKMTI